ncbi:hypothetical protein SpiGrapes_0187 [Sphaerochaeta pleomorpha str. Grapes]|uniref:Uncharacterized protein n=1 Tax=Sphaerochaeta pleomorpha (strain ATCC BAA-1885 / DSM 22778 / Grapes) TaxID=158190 RepID=G8QU81_SPHPG|nr:hypothetical protein [Sphaerochaeta pleomorpha]AEV28051.1 hypothetical protein SpiGrapes_0187 [Sphaerochaeta pleomorpha str. Grapes]
MKKHFVLYLLLVSVCILMLFSSCTTMTSEKRITPYSASVSFPAEGPYTVLGRVSYVSSQGTAGYRELLQQAKIKYPSADDVVNILVDSEDTFNVITDSFTGAKQTSLVGSVYSMSGIAISYTTPLQD